MGKSAFWLSFLVTFAIVPYHGISAWSPSPSKLRAIPLKTKLTPVGGLPMVPKHNHDQETFQTTEHTTTAKDKNTLANGITAGLVTFIASTLPAEAVDAASSPFLSALVAYGHYLSIIVIAMCVAVERFTIKPNMTLEEEQRVAAADITLGITGVLVLVTGYLRATDLAFGKGWAFYSHEPLFWVKMLGVSVFGAASFFPTTKIIQRSIAQRTGKFDPMSEKLANRLTQVLNAEILAIASIPLLATLMSRGVLYADWIPWQAEAALVPVVLLGLGGKYIKEALDWKEDEVPKKSSS